MKPAKQMINTSFFKHTNLKLTLMCVLFVQMMLNYDNTVKPGFNERGCYKEHISRANWSFYHTNLPGYNKLRL